MTRTLLVLAAALGFGATAQAQNSKVLPIGATSTEGNSACYYPFLYNAGHAQVVWDGRAVSATAAVLNSIRFRRDTTKANYPALSIASHVARMGHTKVSSTTMSTAYARNITGKMTTIFSGKFSVVAQPAPNPGPAPFAIAYPLKTPFIFLSSTGNLLLEWTTGSGQANKKQDYQLDAVTTATSGGTGFIRQFGTWGAFGGKDTASWKGDASKLTPGGSASFALGGFQKGYTSNLIVGLSDSSSGGLKLPFGLGVIGAPGNSLFVSMDVILPFALTKSGSNYVANLSYALPKDPKLVGLSAFVQSYYADSTANAAGLVTSNAMKLTIGSAGPIGKMIADTSTTSATGSVMRFLPVIQFVGSIR